MRCEKGRDMSILTLTFYPKQMGNLELAVAEGETMEKRQL